MGKDRFAPSGSRSINPEKGPKWSVEVQAFKPLRSLTDNELAQAKKLFCDLDRDGSGSIESDEIMFMLRALGQNPTAEMVAALINKFDSGDRDGKIQLREFLAMYAHGMDNQNSSSYEDLLDSLRAIGADPYDEKLKVPKQQVRDF